MVNNSQRRNGLRLLAIQGLAVPIVAVCAQAAYALPLIINAPPSAKAGTIISLQGNDFGTSPVVALTVNSGATVNLTPLIFGNGSVTVKIPTGTADGVYSLRVKNGANYSNYVRVNATTGMHFDTPEVTPGGTFRIFGRNLKVTGVNPTVRFVNGSTSITATVNMGSSDTYILNVTAPSTLTVGTQYDVYVKNGYTASGFTGEVKLPKKLTAIATGLDKWGLGVPWGADFRFYNNNYNVKTDSRLTLHAAGNGTTNDRAAIQGAIDAANAAGGGVVYFPAGTYKCDFNNGFGLTMKSNVVIAGDGRDNTTIQYGYSTPSGNAWFLGFNDNTSRAGVSDITFTNVNSTGNWRDTMASGTNVNKVFFNRMRWNMSTCDQMYLPLSAKQWSYTGCLINQGTDSISGYHGMMVASGTSYFTLRDSDLTHTVGQAINLDDGTDSAILENNHFYLDATGLLPGVQSRHVNLNFATNVAVLNNTIAVINGQQGNGNDGESILSEGGGGNRVDVDAGTVTSSASTTLSDSSKSWPTTFVQHPVVAIVSGTGMGQWRNIVSRTSTTLTLDRAWDIVPPTGSHYAIFNWSAANWLVRGNTFNNTERGIWLYTGSTHDVALVGNNFNNGEGIYLRPQQHLNQVPKPEMSVMYNVQVLNNTLVNTNGLRHAYIANLMIQISDTSNFGNGSIGVEIRDNAITATTPNTVNYNSNEVGAEGYINYMRSQASTFVDAGIPSLLGTIFQGNSATNCSYAYYLSSGSYNTILAATLLTNVPNLYKDDGVPGAAHGAVGTTVVP